MFSKTSSKVGWMVFGICFLSVLVARGDGWGGEETWTVILWGLFAAIYSILSTVLVLIVKRGLANLICGIGILIYAVSAALIINGIHSDYIEPGWAPYYTVIMVGVITNILHFLLPKKKDPLKPPSEDVS